MRFAAVLPVSFYVILAAAGALDVLADPAPEPVARGPLEAYIALPAARGAKLVLPGQPLEGPGGDGGDPFLPGDGPGGEAPPGVLGDGPGGSPNTPGWGLSSDGPGGVGKPSQLSATQPAEDQPTSIEQIQLSIADLNRSNLLPTTDPWLEQRVLKSLKFYRDRARRSVQIGLERRAELEPVILETFADAGVPLWLTNLAMVESHFNPKARNPAGYVGLWQLHAQTARDLGLTVNRSIDERLDPEKSTRAVARLLRQHYNAFNDWDLAIAAYAAGGMRVKRALATSPGADLLELVRRGLLPATLLDRVASIHAASRIAVSPEDFGFRAVGRQLAQDLAADIERLMGASEPLEDDQ